MTIKKRMLPKERKEKLAELKEQITTSLELLSDLKNASVNMQRYEMAAGEREMERHLEKVIEMIEGLEKN